MLLLGDNIYAGTIEEKAQKYKELSEDKFFTTFRKKIPIYAIWDDNDYGKSDSGAEYPFKKESQKLFKDFFNILPDSDIGSRDGVYNSQIFGIAGKRAQIIMLDNRFFKSLPKLSPTPLNIGLYVPNEDKTTTILGEAQWKWLEDELKKPAEIRFIASGIQVLPLDQHFESWINFPHERERLLNLIRSNNIGGVVFLSGDRHMGMFLKQKKDMPYEIWEMTSSGLTQALPETAPVDSETNLDGKIYFGPNFGWIKIDWSGKRLILQIRDAKGKVVREKKLKFSSLKVGQQIK